MLNISRPVRPEDYLAMAWRRKWWIIIPFVFISIIGTAIVLRLPKIYRSSTLILVVPQRVPSNYVKATVTSDIQDRLHAISQQIMSRTTLLNIIEQMGLYRKEVRDLAQDGHAGHEPLGFSIY